ncbi:hypothetical protein [Commensalibacter papalotli (ex Servin-Garciduenas et al. 2014)]|uniref:Uncharacterized protein n=1 Tax=Commensalibacter papalotli (ex Servin-Garciduenas et al. 2014) TaxID=1208583 RepID=W7E103_9PROT|nr:hypothetical protein [Commensalibacter papalotli (ex Servin-Garciduenas et al. 2014)]EUK18699.1 hypothetical protein COMX_03085 [Commensalibacter papalotli (ex Servin-Garciduenas et al. 2014)]
MQNIKLYSCAELWKVFKEGLQQDLTLHNLHVENSSILAKIEGYEFNFSYILKECNRNINVNYSDFEKLYSDLKSYKYDNERLSLYSDIYLEEAIFLPDVYSFMVDAKFPITIKNININNKYTITIDRASQKYGLMTLDLYNKAQEKNKSRDISVFLFFSLFNFYNAPENLDINSLLKGFYFTITIKIEAENSKTLEELKQLSESAIFQLMLKSNIGCEYYFTSDSLLNPNKLNYKYWTLKSALEPPKRIYQKHILDYYRLALSSREPFSQYLSYYHIAEYFLDEVFNQNLRKQFQNKITSPHFDSKDDKELNKIINFIKKEIKNCKENGQGNELESLKLVLTKFIEIDELQEKLTSEQIEYYQQNKIKFSNAPTISFKDKQNFYTHLAQRIYKTRNALVHSKDNDKERYKPYQDSEELSKEIPLIKLVAEQVIINSSTPL